MAFDLDGFKAIASFAQGNNVFTYKSDDLLSAIDDSGYFNDAADFFKKGDLILVSGDTDGTPAAGVLVVNSADGAATVTTAVQSNITINYYNQVVLSGEFEATNGTYELTPFGFAGTITALRTVLKAGAVSTNDAVCTFKIGSTAITNGAITITASGSAAGDVDSATPSAANTFTAEQYLAVTVSGTPGGTRKVGWTAVISVTG